MTAQPASAADRPAVMNGGVIFDVSPSPPARYADARPAGNPRGEELEHDREIAGEVLVARLAATVAQHEPGWRLPRGSALARRYGASHRDIGAAIDELEARHLIRRLPDGQLYRASPAEYLLPLEGLSGFGTRLDPMGGDVACRRYRLVRRIVPADVSWTLKIPPGKLVNVVQLEWTSSGEPAAVSTTYLAEHVADSYFGGASASEQLELALQALSPMAGESAAAGSRGALRCRPVALAIELQPALPSAAKTLGMVAGQPVLLVTIRFDDVSRRCPAAVTVAVLRPDMFRVAVRWPAVVPARELRDENASEPI
jgi:DNA-binding GntR family transcriptional regulator